jgi:ATP synthase protein I
VGGEACDSLLDRRDPRDPAVTPPQKGGSSGPWGMALREAAPYLGIGTTLAVTVLLGLGIGYWLDQRLGTEPWLVVTGGMLGVGTALYQFFRTVTGLKK